VNSFQDVAFGHRQDILVFALVALNLFGRFEVTPGAAGRWERPRAASRMARPGFFITAYLASLLATRAPSRFLAWRSRFAFTARPVGHLVTLLTVVWGWPRRIRVELAADWLIFARSGACGWNGQKCDGVSDARDGPSALFRLTLGHFTERRFWFAFSVALSSRPGSGAICVRAP